MSEIVMYIIINKDLKMSPGKIAAQAAHVAVKAYAQSPTSYIADLWYKGSYAKIILKASEYEIKELSKKYTDTTFITIDEGRTEIPKGSLTALAFCPMYKDTVDEIVPEIKNLKLL